LVAYLLVGLTESKSIQRKYLVSEAVSAQQELGWVLRSLCFHDVKDLQSGKVYAGRNVD